MTTPAEFIDHMLAQFILNDYTDEQILATVTTTPATTPERLTALRGEMFGNAA